MYSRTIDSRKRGRGRQIREIAPLCFERRYGPIGESKIQYFSYKSLPCMVVEFSSYLSKKLCSSRSYPAISRFLKTGKNPNLQIRMPSLLASSTLRTISIGVCS